MASPDYGSTGDSIVVGLVYEMRPWQWYKQLIFFIAVVFSGSALEVGAWLRVTAGAIIFSAVAGATYVLNDVSDLEADREHPRKQHRPIASGQVSVRVAVTIAVGLYVVAGVLAWLLNPLFFGLVVVYVGQNALYSAGLKNLLFLDLLSISSGYVLRAIAGVVLVPAQLSPWILLCTFLAALMIGTCKRWGERDESERPTAVRANLDSYTDRTLTFMFGSSATMLLMSYSLYTFFARDIAMMLTLPFSFFAVFRFSHLTFVEGGASEPISLLIDRQLLADFFLWGMVTIGILYVLPKGVVA